MVVATDLTPEETTLGEIMVVNIKIPVSNTNLYLNIEYDKIMNHY